jgi:uncharacterized protein
MDVVIHLAGENVAQRWTSAQRKRILDSRVRGTTLLADSLSRLRRPPVTFISASAIGYYGVEADAPTDESGAPGNDFLATVVQQWEAAAEAARAALIRVVHPRIGLVLSRNGGALARMLPFFRFGLGGRLGSGRQWMSWISMRDLTRAFLHIIDTSQMRGAVNLVAPNAVQNTEFTKTLGKVLHRPTILPVPRLALKLVYGAMAEGTILASQRVVPRALTDSGFVFEHPSLEEALRYELRDTSRTG